MNMAFLTPLIVQSIPDGYWVLISDLEYVDTRYGEITAMAEFNTDLASIPQFLRNIVDPSAPYIKEPAVIHDWIYRGHEKERFTRKQADHIFYRAMRGQGISWMKAQVMYYAVRLFGKGSWK